MPRVHVITVLSPSGSIELQEEDLCAARALAACVHEAGLRSGWLDFHDFEPPSPLGEAVGAGAFRAVQVGPSGSLAYKARKGEPVLADVLRQHFQGCHVVLAIGRPLPMGVVVRAGMPVGAPEGTPSHVRLVEGDRSIKMTPDQFAARLRRPRLFAERSS